MRLIAALALVAAATLGARSLEGEPAQASTGVSARASSCGVERWDVKTLADVAGINLSLHATGQATSIAHLRGLPVVKGPSNSRGSGTERTEFTITNVRLKEAKTEADSDIHLVVADASGRTMIVEFPSLSCMPTTSSAHTATQNAHIQKDRALISAARTAFIAACGLPSSSHFASFATSARGTVTGTGFFDFDHGQNGVAKTNAIELHPVLGFSGHC